MGINLPRVITTKKVLRRLLSLQGSEAEVPKGHMAVYVGESEKKRFTVPISYLKHPSFLCLLNQAEEEFGYSHPMGGLTIPCRIEAFNDLVQCFKYSTELMSH